MSNGLWGFTPNGCVIVNNAWATRLTRFKEGNMRYDKKVCSPTVDDIYRVMLDDGRVCIAVWRGDAFRKGKVLIDGKPYDSLNDIDDPHSLGSNWYTYLNNKVVSWEPI